MKKYPDSPSQQQPKERKTFPFLLLSLFLHALLLVGFQVHNALFSDKSHSVRKDEPSVQFLDIADVERALPMVEQDEKEKVKDNKPKDAKYLSAQDKAVEKETRAANRGVFENKNSAAANAQRASSGAQAAAAKTAAAQTTDGANTAEDMKTFEGGDFAIPSKKQKAQKAVTMADLRPNTMSEMSDSAMASVARTNDSLKNVEIGAETHLNTREFLYYTYFNRIKKKLHQHWEPLIHQKVRKIVSQGRQLASTGDKITRLVITFDDRGTLMRVQLTTTSGLEDLDDAAIEALKAAAPFPNPPKDLIVEGLVKINWDFILES